MVPEWFMRLPINLIESKSKACKLDPYLVAAICWHESRGSVYAVRFEEKYRWLWKPDKFAKKNAITSLTEETLQKHSFGLMQIMGATARWLGYDGALPALYKPENNLYWGTKYLAYLVEKHGDEVESIAAYNAGSPKRGDDGKFVNQDYVNSILKLKNELTNV